MTDRETNMGVFYGIYGLVFPVQRPINLFLIQ